MSVRDINNYTNTAKQVPLVQAGTVVNDVIDPPKVSGTSYKVDTPIYTGLQEFYDRNKDIKTSRVGDQLWEAQGRFDDLNSKSKSVLRDYKEGDPLRFNYCVGEECAARANRVNNSFYNSGRVSFNSADATKTTFGMNLSTKEPPSETQKKDNPHFWGDDNFGSADSWDYMASAKETNPENIIFSALDQNTNTLNYANVADWGNYDIPIGSYVITGSNEVEDPNTGKMVKREGHHTTRVVGFLESGEPLIADYTQIKPMSQLMKSYRGQLAGIISVPGQEHRTFNNFSNISKDASAPSTANYWSENIPKDAGQDYIGYHDGIAGSKNFIVSQLGISPDEYDRYAKIAMTIPAQESEYGNGTVYKALDWLGQTTGPSQLNMKNVSEIYKKTLKKIEDQYGKGTPQYEGAATVLYIRELNKYTKGWAKKGIDARERAYGKRVYGATDLARDVIQGTSPSGYVSDGKSLDLFGLNQDVFVYDRKIEGTGKTEKATVNLPYKQIWQDNKDYTKEVNDMLPEGLKFQYNSKGNPTIIKATYGNTIPNTLENNVFYSWQSPNALRNGDAQGNSIYYKKLVAAYKSLYGKLPSNRNGGEIIALSNRVSILNKLKK